MATIRGLRVNLGGPSDILSGIDCDLKRGEVTALIGLNGAGKTTLLRALLGEVAYTGEVRFSCRHSAQMPGHIGYVPQRLRIEGNLPLTVLDLFGVSLSSWPWFLASGQAMRARAVKCLEEVGMPHLIDSQVSVISGGELQRVLLALALQPTPEMLFLDEPAAGVDWQTQEGFYALIGRLNRELGVTVLLVSHDLSMVARVAGHVLCLKDGRIECQGTPEAVLAGGALERTFGSHQGLFTHRH
jgi:zinc transport system ATP-binding protein